MSQESQIEAESSNPHSVGTGDYVVRQGDCISSIAFTHGHFWETIWQDPGNAELRRVRKDPNVLLPGDRVTIPPIQPKQENKPTDTRHRFVRRGVPAMLRLRVMLEDSEESPGQGAGGSSSASSPPPRPRANQPYRLQIDGTMFEGVTDSDGQLAVRIPPDARHGKLTIGPDNTIIQLDLGALDPVDEITGVQGRLNNLGFNCGAPDGVINSATTAALRYFQQQNGLEPTGEPDKQTRDKLKQVHGS